MTAHDDRSVVGQARLIRRFRNSHGDVWAATWADDGEIYALSDDTEGFDHACSSNVAIHRIVGDSVDALSGTTLSALPELGAFMEVGPDGATWKGTGLTCVDGLLHLAVSRHRYGTAPYFVQQCWDAFILTSFDHGVTWEGRLDQPVFPGSAFANPNFVQVGKDGGDDEFVYAISNDATWNNGSTMTLGRFERTADPRHASEWTFWTRTDEWVSDPAAASFIFRSPGLTSMTGATWIAALGLYCMPQWSYEEPVADHARGGDWFETVTTTPTRLQFFTAPQLWGPWTSRTTTSSAEGWYNPSILLKPVAGVDARSLGYFAAALGGKEMEFYGLNLLELDLESLVETFEKAPR